MHAYLKSLPKRQLGHSFEIRRRSYEESGVPRVVRVRREKRGTTRAQGSVRIEFDCANPDVSIVEITARTNGRVVKDIRSPVGRVTSVARHKYIVPKIEFPLPRQ